MRSWLTARWLISLCAAARAAVILFWLASPRLLF